jgi:hypothetical protein
VETYRSSGKILDLVYQPVPALPESTDALVLRINGRVDLRSTVPHIEFKLNYEYLGNKISDNC